MSLLSIKGLTVTYAKKVPALRDVSLEIAAGESVGLAGESGSGKSTLGLAILGLLPKDSAEVRGEIIFNGQDLSRASEPAFRALRGGRIAMVFQDPFSALNPVLRVGEQVEEALELHGGGRGRAKAEKLFREVQLPDPARIYDAYPHQLSGGQRQRVCLAMAVAGSPDLLVADEPTTALDVTVQREILNLLDDLRRRLGMAVLLISHNIGLLSERTDRLGVMYAGEIVELGPTKALLNTPAHPYTAGLLKALPRLSGPQGPLPALPGQPPDPRALPSGCPFHPRCPQVFEPCPTLNPELLPVGETQAAACHLHHAPH